MNNRNNNVFIVDVFETAYLNVGGVPAPKETGDDALAALMSEAGIEEQAVRLRKLKVNRGTYVNLND